MACLLDYLRRRDGGRDLSQEAVFNIARAFNVLNVQSVAYTIYMKAMVTPSDLRQRAEVLMQQVSNNSYQGCSHLMSQNVPLVEPGCEQLSRLERGHQFGSHRAVCRDEQVRASYIDQLAQGADINWLEDMTDVRRENIFNVACIVAASGSRSYAVRLLRNNIVF